MKNLLMRLWSYFVTYQERRAMYIMLNTLTARQLQDIGLSKDNIEQIFVNGKEA